MTVDRPEPPRAGPLQRFLGVPAGDAGPFAMLELEPHRCTDEGILSALDGQLARIAAHPQRDTPEADEVRLALHAAAAQLLHPGVRRLLLQRAGVDPDAIAPDEPDLALVPETDEDGAPRVDAAHEPVSAADVASPVLDEQARSGMRPSSRSVAGAARAGEPRDAGEAHPQPPPLRLAPAPPDRHAIERDLLLAMGAGGGWRATTLREVLMRAHAAGASTEDVVDALRAMGHGPASQAPSDERVRADDAMPANVRAAAPPTSAPSAAEVEPARSPRGVDATSSDLRGRGFAPPRSTGAPPAEVTARAEAMAEPRGGIVVRDTPVPGVQRALLVGVCVIALAFVAVVVALIVLPTAPGGRGETTTPSNPGAGSTSAAGAGATATAQDPPPRDAEPADRVPAGETASPPRDARATLPAGPVEILTVIRELRAAADELPTARAAAIERFAAAQGTLAGAWPEAPREHVALAIDASTQFLHRLGDDAAATREVASGVRRLAAGLLAPDATDRAPASLLAGIYASGLLAHAARQADLPVGVRTALALPDPPSLAGGPAFDEGIAAGARASISRLVGRAGDASAAAAPIASDAEWAAWLRAVAWIGAYDAASAQRLVLAAAEAVLVDRPEPDAGGGPTAALVPLVRAANWRADGLARAWLVRALTDPRLSIADVRTLTAVVARESAAEGIDATMVLAMGADAADRAALRDRFATAWGGLSGASGEAARRWAEAARAALGREPARSPLDQAAALARLARLNAAAEWIARDDPSQAQAMLALVDAPVDAAVTPAAGAAAAPETPGGDGEWARRQLVSRGNLKARRESLAELAQRRPMLGPIDAEVLVLEALGAPGESRAVAAELVKDLAGQTWVVNAVLERLPRIAPTPANAALVEAVAGVDLPPSGDPRWPLEARRALVDKLMEKLAGAGNERAIDALAMLTAEAYLSAAAPSASAIALAPGAASDAPEVAARRLIDARRLIPTKPTATAAIAVEWAAIDRRRDARLALARGPLQRFAAEQLAGVETLEAIVRAEQPARAQAASAVLESLRRQRRAATHVLAQLAAAERAATELWLLRFQEDQP